MNIIWRVAGIGLAVGLTLFLLSLVLKFLLVGLGLFLLVRVVGPRLAAGRFARAGRGDWQASDIISIDNPAYRAGHYRQKADRIIAIA